MPSEIRAVTDANWAGELEGLRSTSCGWICFGDHLLETYSSTQQIVALATAEYISLRRLHGTWRRPRASLGCAVVVAATVRARLGEQNEADLGTKMVDLRRTPGVRKLSLNCLFAGRNNNNFDICRPPGN